jgi:hypothetical protein
MTTAILFKKHRAGEISKEKFLYEVRRDQQLPFITNMTSYEDSIKILKNKSIVKESGMSENYEVHYSDGIRQAKKFSDVQKAMSFAKDLIGTNNKLQHVDIFKAGPKFNSTADTNSVIAWWGDKSYMDNASKKDPTLAAKKISLSEATAQDNIHPYTLKKGAEAELLKGGEITNLAYAKAVATATKKLAKDPTAYDDLHISNSEKIKKADAKLEMTPVKGENFVDKNNGMKKVKGFHDAKSNTKASKKENRKGNPKGVKMMKESTQLDILKGLLSKKKVELTEDMHPTYGMGQEVPLPEEDIKEFKSQTGIVKNIFGGTLELEIQREGEEPLIINRQVNVIDKAKELANVKSQADDKDARDNMWSDWDKRGEKTFAGIKDFPSKIDADRQKKTMGIVEKLRKFLKKDKKKDVDEGTKFKAGGEVMFTPDNMAVDKEAELRKAGVKFTKTKVA